MFFNASRWPPHIDFFNRHLQVDCFLKIPSTLHNKIFKSVNDCHMTSTEHLFYTQLQDATLCLPDVTGGKRLFSYTLPFCCFWCFWVASSHCFFELPLTGSMFSENSQQNFQKCWQLPNDLHTHQMDVSGGERLFSYTLPCFFMLLGGLLTFLSPLAGWSFSKNSKHFTQQNFQKHWQLPNDLHWNTFFFICSSRMPPSASWM